MERTELFAGILLLSFAGGLSCDLALRHFLKSRKWYGVAPVAAALVAIFLSVYGFSVSAFRCILLCQTLVMAGMVDGATREIPDRFHLLVALVGLVGFQPLPAMCGFLLVPLPFLVAALKTGKIGGGDVKLMAACGLFLGAKDIFYSFFYALILGGVFSIYLILVKKGTRKTRIAFGPFLASGIVLRLIFLIFKG